MLGFQMTTAVSVFGAIGSLLSDMIPVSDCFQGIVPALLVHPRYLIATEAETNNLWKKSIIITF